jgi:hypothetical protein
MDGQGRIINERRNNDSSKTIQNRLKASEKPKASKVKEKTSKENIESLTILD